MPSLVLREGVDYQLEDIEKILSTQELAGSEPAVLAQACLKELSALTLPKASYDLANEEETDDAAGVLPDGSRYLTNPTRRGGIVIPNLVGAATLRCGVYLEVLPKVGVLVSGTNDMEACRTDRAALRRMWEFAADLRLREHQFQANVEEAELPLHEWLMRLFLNEVDILVARGIRSRYVERDDNLYSVRGRLLVARNLQVNSLAPDRFMCRFEEFSVDRPENRLIRTAVDCISKKSKNKEIKQRAFQLSERLSEIPLSINIRHDFMQWRDERLMAEYRQIRSTCRWILDGMGPAPIGGDASMIGRFMRMNDVFERYVARWMQQKLSTELAYELIEQKSSTSGQRKALPLCTWKGKKRMMLPDLLIYSRDESKSCIAVLDTKWKRTADKEDGSPRITSGSDLYQMFAYAQHWLGDSVTEDKKLIVLIYPAEPSNGDTTKERRDKDMFSFDNLPNVAGFSLRFKLPTRGKDNQWDEGLVNLPKDSHTLFKPLRAASEIPESVTSGR